MNLRAGDANPTSLPYLTLSHESCLPHPVPTKATVTLNQEFSGKKLIHCK